MTFLGELAGFLSRSHSSPAPGHLYVDMPGLTNVGQQVWEDAAGLLLVCKLQANHALTVCSLSSQFLIVVNMTFIKI